MKIKGENKTTVPSYKRRNKKAKKQDICQPATDDLTILSRGNNLSWPCA